MRINFLNTLVFGISVLQLSCGQVEKENDKSQEFPFTTENWIVENPDETISEIKTSTFKGRWAIELEGSQIAYLKNKNYKNFVLEFYCNGLSGPGFGFRAQDKKNYEYVYLRLGVSGKKDALQYVPIYNGSLPWQLYNYPKYEGQATFPRKKVTTLPPDFKEQLVAGKASDTLREFLLDKGFSFSEESEIALGDDVNYIFDPKGMKALLFSEANNEITFLDPRTWIHFKVEVIENEAKFYVEDMEVPTFVVENLKRDVMAGAITLIGDGAGVHYSDVKITELQKLERAKNKPTTEKLSDNYLTKWQLSEMFTKNSLNFVSQIDSIFQYKNKFKSIEADEDGLVNISRFYDDMTKTVVLRSSLESDSDRMGKLNFDYADHLVILLNSEILFDKGMDFAPPIEKGEEGRVFVEDEGVELNLKKGNNQLVFMLSADNRQKFNWGFVAKLETINGIKIE